MVQNASSYDDGTDEEERSRTALVPQDAPSTVTQEFIAELPSHVDESSKVATAPMGVVWAEARVETPTVSQEASGGVSIPHVTVVPVEIDNETLPTSINVPSNVTDSTMYSERTEVHYTINGLETSVENDSEAITVTPLAASTCSLYRWNFIVFTVGNSLLLAAALATFGLEVSAITLYMVGAAFFYTAEGLSKLGEWTLPLQTLFRMLSVIHLSVDLILLTISTLLVELLSWIAGIVCILFGGITVGIGMHQHIRRVCQWIRTMFRKIHAKWNPPRMEPYDFHDNESADELGEASAVSLW